MPTPSSSAPTGADQALLDRNLWLNVHPSLLPRWRGPAPVERAIMAGDAETGVTIHRTTAELDAGPIAAQRAFAIEPDDDAGAVYERAAPVAVELLDDVLAGPRFAAQPDEGVTYAGEDHRPRPELDWSRPPEEIVNRVRALSPIGARAVLEGRPVIVWQRGSPTGAPSRSRCSPRAVAGCRTTRFCARPAMSASPARAVAQRGRPARVRAGGLRGPRFRRGGGEARASATARSRSGSRTDDPARPHARPRHRDARSEAGAETRSPGAAALQIAAYQLAFLEGIPDRAAVHESVELVRAAGLERAVAFTNAVGRRLAAGLRARHRAAGRTPEEAALRHSYRTGSPTCGGGTSGRTRRVR